MWFSLIYRDTCSVYWDKTERSVAYTISLLHSDETYQALSQTASHYHHFPVVVSPSLKHPSSINRTLVSGHVGWLHQDHHHHRFHLLKLRRTYFWFSAGWQAQCHRSQLHHFLHPFDSGDFRSLLGGRESARCVVWRCLGHLGRQGWDQDSWRSSRWGKGVSLVTFLVCVTVSGFLISFLNYKFVKALCWLPFETSNFDKINIIIISK